MMILTHHKEQQNQAMMTEQQINDDLPNFEKSVMFLCVYEGTEYHIIYLLRHLRHLESKTRKKNHTMYMHHKTFPTL